MVSGLLRSCAGAFVSVSLVRSDIHVASCLTGETEMEEPEEERS